MSKADGEDHKRVTAVSVAVASRWLSQASGQAITEEMLRRDIADGAPVNADGTINLIFYAAWLIKANRRA